MPHTYTRPFRIRYYECDPYGHVNNATYLRYATQAAMEASADAGYDLEQYAALGTVWFIREAGIEYLRPVKYGDTLNVKTWVSDFRRVRSRREYEMTNAATGKLAARAYTDWVYLDAATSQPARIPPEMAAAFFPEGAPEAGERRPPFPEPPPPPPGAFSAVRRVGWQHLDMEGHMNSAAYLSLLEDVVIDAAEYAGWPMSRVAEAGFAIFARETRIEYTAPALMGDALRVTTYIGEVTDTTVTRHYLIKIEEEVVARAQTLWVCVDVKTGRSQVIPEEWLLDFEAQVADQASGE